MIKENRSLNRFEKGEDYTYRVECFSWYGVHMQENRFTGHIRKEGKIQLTNREEGK